MCLVMVARTALSVCTKGIIVEKLKQCEEYVATGFLTDYFNELFSKELCPDC